MPGEKLEFYIYIYIYPEEYSCIFICRKFSFDSRESDYIFSFVNEKQVSLKMSVRHVFRIIYILIQDIAARNHKDQWLR